MTPWWDGLTPTQIAEKCLKNPGLVYSEECPTCPVSDICADIAENRDSCDNCENAYGMARACVVAKALVDAMGQYDARACVRARRLKCAWYVPETIKGGDPG